MTEKLEFASPEWIDEARRHLQATIPALGDEIAGETYEACEIFTDPPAHLAQDGTNRVAWWFRIEGPNADVGDGVPEWYTKTEYSSDYAEILPIARLVFQGNPDAMAQVAEFRERKERERAERGEPPFPTPENVHPKIAAALTDLHDHMARITA